MKAHASFSKCSRYRYLLGREWSDENPPIVFVGLNPSTADAFTDDPTIRRCIRFAREWGFGSLIMANLFAFRSPDPNELLEIIDPIGKWNDEVLALIASLRFETVFMWGTKGSLRHRDEIVKPLFPNARCFGVNQDQSPKHPLYLKSSTSLVAFCHESESIRMEKLQRACRPTSYYLPFAMLEQRSPYIETHEDCVLPIFV